MTVINSIQNKSKKNLIKSIFRNYKKQIMYYPASINNQYNFRSGFLEQLVMTSELAKKIGPMYNIDQDLLMTGILLYNIGVIKEINSNYEFDYTNDGVLIGRRVLGKDLVNNFVKDLKIFPEETLLKINHIILSGIGDIKKEKFKLPSFREAILVHMIISLDMKMNIMKLIIRKDQNNGDFTNKFNYYGIPILKGNSDKDKS